MATTPGMKFLQRSPAGDGKPGGTPAKGKDLPDTNPRGDISTDLRKPSDHMRSMASQHRRKGL